MKHDSQWPPPEWTEVIITWDTMNTKPTHKPPLIAEWLETAPGHGHYHLHGWRSYNNVWLLINTHLNAE